MKSISKTLACLLAVLLVLQPVFSWAGSGARVIPSGKVSLLEDGKEVNQFQSEMPLPEGSMMLCNGSCVVQTPNLQLVAADRAVFAVAEGSARWDLTVKSGQVNFALRSGDKPISFHTPYDTIQTGQAIVPASSGAVVRGALTVTETESVLALQEGTLKVMTPDGTQLLQPGQGVRLAQTQTTPPQSQEQKEEKKDKAGAAVAAGGSGATYGGLSGTTWAIIGAVVVIGAVTGIAVAASSSGNGEPVSGF